ncbi:transcriptional regulator [Lentilactobacillus fungorum]|uniref:Transcriptional regulator n=1 Tax=Lentilactobacillus fungorum TaxID=2201250 RepID=A0ABQ3VYV8_9LACO|nr:helix-turn-helix transcriptional regulator [Lentilactobacillus fungorum]GHP14073.1 transcriptional regulator [Lentilactobacillus fungorum]
MVISDKLKQCRKNKNMTQQDVADKLHVSRKTVSGWENGRSYPDINMIVLLSDLFDVATDDLIRDDRMLSYYEDQDRQNKRYSKVVRASYVINILLLIVSYLHTFYIRGFHSSIMSFLLIVNICILLTLYGNWSKFKRKWLLGKLVGVLIIGFSINILLNYFNRVFLMAFSNSDLSTALGIIIGKVLIDLFMAVSWVGVIFLNPFLVSNGSDFKK